MSIEIHGKFLLGRLLLSVCQLGMCLEPSSYYTDQLKVLLNSWGAGNKILITNSLDNQSVLVKSDVKVWPEIAHCQTYMLYSLHLLIDTLRGCVGVHNIVS